MEILTSTLVERVQAFVQHGEESIEWESPLLSTVPFSTAPAPLAIHVLAAQLAAAEKALVDIVLDVQALAVQVQKLAAQVAAVSGDR